MGGMRGQTYAVDDGDGDEVGYWEVVGPAEEEEKGREERVSVPFFISFLS